MNALPPRLNRKEAKVHIDGKTRLIGILGDPVAHSLSPRMQNAAFQAAGLNFCYVPLRVKQKQLPAAVEGLRAMQFRGANVTIPHKVPAAELLDCLDRSAARTGAVNTIVNDAGKLTGYNTDGAGFIAALAEAVSVEFPSATAVILGAGGAARSVAVALAEKGVPRIAIINRTLAKARGLKALLKLEFPDIEAVAVGLKEKCDDLIISSKLLVNATSLGMDGDLKRLPVAVDKLTEGHIVCDLVYGGPGDTALLAAAREKGATLMGGLGMLLHQGAASFKLWTSAQPPIEVMRKALESQ